MTINKPTKLCAAIYKHANHSLAPNPFAIVVIIMNN